jgi:predicted hotdog family 3-hydroxylacyl-ACP dehydratase
MTNATFPLDASMLTPHKRPMLAIDKVLAADANGGRIALTVPADAWYMNADGHWDELAGIELISQAAAAFNGFTAQSENSSPTVGYLAEVRKYEVTGVVSAGDALVIDVRKTTAFGGFLVMTGELRREDAVIATAELTFWQETPGAQRPARSSTVPEGSSHE